MFIVWLYLFKNIIQLQGNGMAAISKIVNDLKDAKPREAVLKLHIADLIMKRQIILFLDKNNKAIF